MITPRFRLSQNEHAVIITIHAPFSRVADAEVFMDKQDFRFHSNPYYLRLHLPGEITENDEAKAHFDSETNEYIITCSKVNKGEHFQGLDLITNLLQPKGKREIEKPGIDALSSTEEECTESETEFDWFVDQKIAEESLSSRGAPYGFGSKYSGLFATLAEELHEVLDVKNPDDQSLADRRSERVATENKEFNPEHYLADFFQRDMVDPIIEYQASPSSNLDDWTETEVDLLKSLPSKDFLLEPEQLQCVYLGLVDILLAYSYDARITMGDPTVESAWTIAKLSGTLSWLEVFPSIRDAVLCFLRRSLCYPLHRNFELSLKAVGDARELLKRGKKPILKCLLQIFGLFNKSEPRYLLNQLYVQDYCIWIQKASEETLVSLADALESMKWSKDDVDLRLADLEEAATNLLCESDSDSDLDDRLSKLSIGRGRNKSNLPMDLLVAAEAARQSSSESELDSDDLSSEESDSD